MPSLVLAVVEVGMDDQASGCSGAAKEPEGTNSITGISPILRLNVHLDSCVLSESSRYSLDLIF